MRSRMIDMEVCACMVGILWTWVPGYTRLRLEGSLEAASEEQTLKVGQRFPYLEVDESFQRYRPENTHLPTP